MIIKGSARAGAVNLARHLNRSDNERVAVLQLRGVAAGELRGALVEMDAHGAGTRCKATLYHAQINPERGETMTPAHWREAVDRLEKNLGLTGQPRAVVMHTKKGRDHVHVVWSRIDVERGRAISNSFDFRKHQSTARELEQAFGHRHVTGPHAGREPGQERPVRAPSRAAMQQAARTGIDPRDISAEVQEVYRRSDTGRAFEAALAERGYALARGDRRDVVLVDQAGGVHSLARRLGVRKKELQDKMSDLDTSSLPALAEVRQAQHDARPADEREQEQRQTNDRRAEQDRRRERQGERSRDRERLYQAYQAERQERREKDPGPSRAEAAARYAELRDRDKADREAVFQATKAGSAERAVGLSLASFRAIERRERLRAELARERQEARGPGWREWLDRRAETDQAAARYRDWLDRRAEADQAQDRNRRDDDRQQDRRREDDRDASVTRGVTYDRTNDAGGVAYAIDGRKAVETRAQRVVVHAEKSHQAIALGLELYRQQHGERVRVEGSDAFKTRVAEVAAERGMKLQFIDPRLAGIYAERRQEIEAERQAVQAVQPGRAAGLDARLPGRVPTSPGVELSGPTPAQAAQQAREAQQQQERAR